MEELRAMQLDMVKMIADIDKLFSSNGIKYTLLGGSVLGAVRHNGFIPWDDDIDIGVLRKDFDYAESLLSNLEPYTYEFAEDHIIPDAPIGHLHFVNDKYTLEHSPTIDIFAIDNVPELEKNRKKLRFYANLHHLSVLRQTPKNRGKAKKLLVGFILKIVPPFIWNIIKTKSLKKIITFCKSDEYLGNVFGFWTEKEYFPKNIYEELVLHDFENVKLPIPKEYHQYLTQMYGDYMQLPPVEKRKPKHREF